METTKNNLEYGSHLPFLKIIIKAFNFKSVLELGLGDNSTPFFLDHICMLHSVEQQDEEWLNRIKNKIGNQPMWGAEFLPYPKLFEYSKGHYDLVFIDGHHKSRADDVNYAFHKANLIVAHDFEKKNYYQWHKIQMPDDYRLIVYDEKGKQTALFAHESVL